MSFLTDALSSMDWQGLKGIGKDIIDGGEFDWSRIGDVAMNSLGNYFGQEKAEQAQLEAESRENAEYDRRVEDERAYNDPSAQAERLKSAGINPMSVMAGSSTASGNTTTAGAPNNAQSSMSDVLAFMQLQNETKIADATVREKDAHIDNLRAGTGKLTVETALAEWDIKLKEQLFNYNSENYPILLEAGQQKLKNLAQEYNNLVAKEDYDKANADKVRKDIQKAQEEIWLLQLQYYQGEQQIELNSAKLKQMAQDFEKGEFEKQYLQWHSQHEKALANIAVTRGKITEKEWSDLWESGLMKEKTEEEIYQIKKMAGKLLAETQELITLGLGNSSDGFGGYISRLTGVLLYFLTELI